MGRWDPDRRWAGTGACSLLVRIGRVSAQHGEAVEGASAGSEVAKAAFLGILPANSGRCRATWWQDWRLSPGRWLSSPSWPKTAAMRRKILET